MSLLPRRVLFVTHEAGDRVSGNNTTIDRFAREARAHGVEAEVARVLPEGGSGGVARHAAAWRPQVVHALHARHAGPAGLAAAAAAGCPFVLTSGGTDLDQDPHDPALRQEVRAVVARASVVLVSHEAAEAMARTLAPGVVVRRVPQAVLPPPPEGPSRRAEWAASEEVLFALPAGVRPVKNNRFPVAPLARLRAEGVPVRLVLAGPERDAAYAAALRADLAPHPWASWGGALDADGVEGLLRAADVVLNASHSEGGSNAVLEAMARGRCVLASGVPGNAAFLRVPPGEPEVGRLYRATPSGDPRAPLHDAEDFLRHARDLAARPALRASLGAAARARVEAVHTPEAEWAAVVDAWRLALEASG